MSKKDKSPSLFRQIISIHYEQAKRRKALRLLSKQEWSVEFLEYLIVHAAKTLGKDIEMEVTSPKGHKFIIRSTYSNISNIDDSDDIFNHLDDEAAVNKFILDHNKRREVRL